MTSRWILGRSRLCVSGIARRIRSLRGPLDLSDDGVSVGPAVFTCGTQMVPYQRMQFLGTRAALRSRFRSMLRTTGQRGFLLTMDATCLAAEFGQKQFRFAINILCRETRFRGRFARRRSPRTPGGRDRQYGGDRGDFSSSGVWQVGAAGETVRAGSKRPWRFERSCN